MSTNHNIVHINNRNTSNIYLPFYSSEKKIKKRILSYTSIIALFIISFSLLPATVFSQASSEYWYTVVKPPHNAKYFLGNSAPGTGWNTNEFNDQLWISSTASVGYADNDDLTTIPSTLSVFVRTTFNISSIDEITRAVFHMDYDDAFVAYINGVEIARSNISTVGVEPSYNTPAYSNHEAQMYQGGMPDEFSISKIKLDNCLISGNNTLAIQVHNVEQNSSDLSCIPFFSICLNKASTAYSSIPDWFNPPIGEFYSSNLPIVIIETEGDRAVGDQHINAMMKIAYNDKGKRNYIEGPFHESSGPIRINLRGNSTRGFPKKPYRVETVDETGKNRNVEILGLPKENDWVLKACYLDKTLMRHAIASQMSQNLGRYASRYAFCEVILNGSYDGVYLLMEKIKRDNDRLDLEELYPWTTDPDSITGGYIYEVSQIGLDFGERRRFVYPKAEDINAAQTIYIRNYDDKFRMVMRQHNYADPKTGYPMWIDVKSFIDEILVQEACKNSDAYGWSSYFHKDRGKKLSAGPVWDFDQALSNSTFNDGNKIDEWNINKVWESVPTFWRRMFNEPTFKYLLKKRWLEVRENALHTDSIVAYIDSTALYIDEAQRRNFNRWPVLGNELWRSPTGWWQRDTYKKEVDYMKDWLYNRLEWMDGQLQNVPDQIIDIPNLVITEIMYDPIMGSDEEFIEIYNAEDEDIDLTGISFSDGIDYSFPMDETIGAGEYLVIAASATMFRIRHGFNPFGEYEIKLDNSGERVALQNSFGCIIDEVTYDNKTPWPVIGEAKYGSIELIDVNLDNNLPENWKLSLNANGTPMAEPEETWSDSYRKNSISVYPNPASNFVNIQFAQVNNARLKITLHDLSGSQKARFGKHNFSGFNTTIDIRNLQNGYYILKISIDGNATFTSKLIIAK
ncbi:MAG: CotH kinase family protein [Prolixibacteraceae bacterium]|jgi:hypothetical protein|nr:CotH kinase family protein [Prolixibacteraceae bacterium]